MAELNQNYDAVMEKTAREEANAYDKALVLPPLTGDGRRKKKKSSGAFGIFRAALFMLRKRTDEKEGKKKSSKSADNGDWKKIVGSMRPLHVQGTPESPMHAMSPANDGHGSASPAPSTSSGGTMSQYASASSLRDLYNSDDEEERDPDEVFDAITGDEMIDSKADEFIAQFYKQIHHQNSISRSRQGKRGS